MTSPDPQLLSTALAELIALRGFARPRAEQELQDTWRQVAGEDWSAATKPQKITRGVLYVEVKSSALLGMLTAFHRPELTAKFQQQAPHLNVKSIKFRLAGL
jgi:predicted nucleic acid-binding Zn ribbon protein